ncbi:hypothetical protein IJGMMPBP_00083 [Infectious spleen and kidney necrosis virus]|uniref:Uncharacterized protein n=1 Tax=Infectious spleen and kidney necrosis virus TaxID=180170 RepID=A0A7U1BJD4_ISKNV|nr:hypothetical protein IJGMMPBP_00083 [Infectious spleen and kidney necrosis virus]QQZ00631.1 hypothetical protein NIDBEMMG_00056 [Infectious spleen and kidney necrosis virus]WNY63501.1 hypothetical protein AOEHFIPN_00058 [Infectious spleen and kidney necrosis virus]
MSSIFTNDGTAVCDDVTIKCCEKVLALLCILNSS